MRNSCIALTLIMAIVAAAALSALWSGGLLAADAPEPAPPTATPAPLKDADRLLVRDAQLALAQAHIARLQAEADVTAAKTVIGQLVQSLKTKYACPDCTLNSDFTWTPEPTPAQTVTVPSSAATPTPEGGTNSKKE